MKWAFYLVLLIIAGNIILEIVSNISLASNPALMNRLLDQQQADKEARERLIYGMTNQRG